MAFQSKFKRKFFFYTVKSPAGTLLVVVLMVAVLLLIMYFATTNVYYPQTGKIEVHRSPAWEAIIVLELDARIARQINPADEVIWYLDQAGRRYQGAIGQIEELPGKNKFALRIRPKQEEIQLEFKQKPSGEYPVQVELLIRKERIIDHLFSPQPGGAP